jgi:hypothetical protein
MCFIFTGLPGPAGESGLPGIKGKSIDDVRKQNKFYY